MIDGHVHLEKGPLTVAYVMEMVDAAVRMGMDTLQILDHTHRFHEFEPLYTTVKARHPLQAAWLAKKRQGFTAGLSSIDRTSESPGSSYSR